jgi:hypothetical protein
MSTTAVAHRIVLQPIIRDGRHHHGADGPLYSVRHDGTEIVASTRQPLLDGARALQAMGLAGPLELWDDTRPFPRMTSTVEAAAGQTVQEGRKQSPKLAKWVPFAGLQQDAQDGHLR